MSILLAKCKSAKTIAIE